MPEPKTLSQYIAVNYLNRVEQLIAHLNAGQFDYFISFRHRKESKWYFCFYKSYYFANPNSVTDHVPSLPTASTC